MKLLPTQQTDRQADALRQFLDARGVSLNEPCDCGSQVRHNNGGNYHAIVNFTMNAGKCWRTETFTGDYGPDDDWKEIAFSAAVDEIAQLAAKGWHVSRTGR